MTKEKEGRGEVGVVKGDGRKGRGWGKKVEEGEIRRERRKRREKWREGEMEEKCGKGK